MLAERLAWVAGCWLIAGCSREPIVDGGTVAGRPVQVQNKPAPGVAVVELFTSEGCSSCPPADHVLSRLAARAKTDSVRLYPLSFHVDYWNDLGWRDRFSRASYSERQSNYAAIGTSGGTYTPQLVVNGAAECIGSNERRVDALIAVALQQEPRTRIELTARRTHRGVEVNYRVSGDSEGRVLNLALVEPRVETQVESGENAGERLVHVNVVRLFTTRALSDATSGSWTARPDSDFASGLVGVVAFAEAASQRDISGAAALEL